MPAADELYRQAEQLKDEGKSQEAISLLLELLNEEPHHALSHLALAVLYGKVGDHEKAVHHGRTACEIDPHDAFSFTAMSVTYQRAWQGTQDPKFIQLAEEAMAQAHLLEGHG